MESKKQLYTGIGIGAIISLFLCSVVFWGSAAIKGIGGGGMKWDSPPILGNSSQGGESKNRAGQINQKMNQIVSILDKYYVDGIDYESLEEGMYNGLVGGVGDRYTSYMSSDDYRSFIETMSGSYAGIGIYVYPNTDDRMITVSAPIKDSPGEASGLLPNDKIIKVDGIEVTGDKIDEAIAMIKGKPGTNVVITIFRKDTGETFDLTITRAHIDVPTVEAEMLEGKIGYIMISSFDDNTAEQFGKALTDLNAQGQEALIIDVRNNLGGYLNRVVEICDMLLPESTIVYREDKAGNKKYETATSRESFDKPIAVLINGASASASEILAGALKDNEKAVLVGTTTFGKGLVQQLFKLEDNSAVKVTVERYYTPSGVCINGIGIEPDFEVEFPKELESVIEVEAEDDPQLQKAVEVMNIELGR